MKKISVLVLVVMCALLMFGCNDTGVAPNETVPVGVAWSSTAADPQLVGAWTLEGSENNEIHYFTEDCKIRIVTGSVYLEGDVMYGVDSIGDRKLQSDFHYLSGQFSYLITNGKALIVNSEGVTQTLVRVNDYKEPELSVPEDFNKDNPLIGTWYNDEYLDSYTFNADGTASYDLTSVETVFRSHIDYTYKVVDDKLHFTYDDGTGVKTSISVFTIKDGVLDIDGVGGFVLQ